MGWVERCRHGGLGCRVYPGTEGTKLLLPYPCPDSPVLPNPQHQSHSSFQYTPKREEPHGVIKERKRGVCGLGKRESKKEREKEGK